MFSKVLTTVVVACAVVMNGCKSNIKTHNIVNNNNEQHFNASTGEYEFISFNYKSIKRADAFSINHFMGYPDEGPSYFKKDSNYIEQEVNKPTYFKNNELTIVVNEATYADGIYTGDCLYNDKTQKCVTRERKLDNLIYLTTRSLDFEAFIPFYAYQQLDDGRKIAWVYPNPNPYDAHNYGIHYIGGHYFLKENKENLENFSGKPFFFEIKNQQVVNMGKPYNIIKMGTDTGETRYKKLCCIINKNNKIDCAGGIFHEVAVKDLAEDQIFEVKNIKIKDGVVKELPYHFDYNLKVYKDQKGIGIALVCKRGDEDTHCKLCRSSKDPEFRIEFKK